MKKSTLLAFFFFLMGSIFSPTTSKSEVLSLALYHYYPFLLENHSERGYAFDVTNAIFEKAGFEVKFRYLPLIRAIVDTSHLHYDAILGLSPIHSDELIYSNTPITSLKFFFWTRTNFDWVYRSTKDLERVRVITISGFNYSLADAEYQNYLEQKKKNVNYLTGGSSIERAFEMIALKRADAFCLDLDHGTMVLKKLNLFDKFKKAGELKNLYRGYFGVSKRHPKKEQFITVFEKGMKTMRESGELETIVDKYRDLYGLLHSPYQDYNREKQD